MHLLDIGCGIGGPSRYFATSYGCRVTGIDLTDEFVVARRFAVAARRGSTIRSPTGRRARSTCLSRTTSFDGAYMMHVGMNIADKAHLFAEVHRVLKPGGASASST